MLRRAITVGGWILIACCASACPGDEEDQTPDRGTDVQTFAQSTCGRCLPTACSYDYERCAADPACAGYLECVLDCPIDTQGEIVAACEQTCPLPATVTSQERSEALTDCRTQMDCISCDPVQSDGDHPIYEQTCEPSATVEVCDKCEEEMCCETPCDASCEALLDCLEPCVDQPFSCDEACLVENPDGVAATAKWFTCMSTQCRMRCPRWAPPHECIECSVSNCPNEYAGCYADPECFMGLLCRAKCSDQACVDECDQQYPGGVDLESIFLGCVLTHCHEICA